MGKPASRQTTLNKYFSKPGTPVASATDSLENDFAKLGGLKVAEKAHTEIPYAHNASVYSKTSAEELSARKRTGEDPTGFPTNKRSKTLESTSNDAPDAASSIVPEKENVDLKAEVSNLDKKRSPTPDSRRTADTQPKRSKRAAELEKDCTQISDQEEGSPKNGGSKKRKSKKLFIESDKEEGSNGESDGDGKEREEPASVRVKNPWSIAKEQAERKANEHSDKSEKVMDPMVTADEAQSDARSDVEKMNTKGEKKKENVVATQAEDHFDFQKDSCFKWEKGASVPYSALCDTFEKCSTTTKRLEIIGFLTSFFHAVLSLSPNSLNQCIYLCLNRIGPEYDTKELGVGESILIKAIAEAAGQTAPSIKSKLNQIGDLGTVAEKVVGTQKRFFGKKQSLTVESVFKSLTEIANFSGANSQNRRMGEIRKMLIDVSSVEARYLVRCLSGKLRIGLAEKTVLIALAKAVVLREQDKSRKRWSPSRLSEEFAQAEKVLKQVYTEIPTYDIIVPHLIVHGMENIQETCKLTPGIPVKPMLAHPTKSLSEILDRFEGIPFTCEFKYDGERAQIHLTEMGAAMVYSRNSENLSGKYPDIIARVPKIYKEGVTSFVLDCEAVAWDRNKSCILPFQAITTRKRKDVSEESIQVQCCVFAFDLLYLNGESLVSHTLQSRREKLYANFNEIPGEFTFAKAMSATAVEDIQTFLDAAVEGNCEGLMVKTLEKDSSYEPSQRSRNWLKVKKDYVNGLGDTLDLVVIGAYFGKGKRTGVYGGYLLACYDEDDEQYQSICKIGTGFSEEDLANHANLLKEHIIPKPPAYYEWSDTPNLTPDIWFSPAMVWEVKAADLSISPVHKAARGLVDPAKGVSLRFPRFVRIRDDKSPEDATKATQVETMYRAQKINNQDDAVMEDDY